MHKVLVVEDSPMVTKVLRHVMSQSSQVEAIYADSLAGIKALAEAHKGDIFAALVDLNLPDAPNGEVVDYTLGLGLPTIVLTGSFDPQRRESLLSKGIVDYVTKEGRYSYNYALNLIHRLIRNQNIKVLYVDDSAISLKVVSNLLKLHLYQVFLARNSAEAIKVLLDNPEIKLLITDYNMPGMDGFELVQNLRSKYEKSDLVIIGISSDEGAALSAKFIKAGANDFLKKPFNQEEFFCRVTHNIESLELIEQIRDAANRDGLTGTFNRHYFLSVAEDMHKQACGSEGMLAVAVVDLDNLAEINETYGNEMGDHALRSVAQTLMGSFARFLVGRAGGEKFLVLMGGLDNEKAVALVEKVRQIASVELEGAQGDSVVISLTAGVSNYLGDSFSEMLSYAYQCLDRALEAGGNLVFGDDEWDEEET